VRVSAERHALLALDAVAMAALKKGSKRERFTDEEIERIFAAIGEIYSPDGLRTGRRKSVESQYKRYSYVRAFLLALRYTALRIGAVVALRRDYITGDRLRHHEIEIEAQKAGTVFTVIPPVLIEALKEIEGETPYYFYPHATLDPESELFETWKKDWSATLLPVYKKAGVKYRSHAWRDTLVFKLLRKGVSLEIIARLLGHSDISMTWDHYAAWVPELQERLESVIRAYIHEV
jgi:integrase